MHAQIRFKTLHKPANTGVVEYYTNLVPPPYSLLSKKIVNTLVLVAQYMEKKFLNAGHTPNNLSKKEIREKAKRCPPF